MYCSSFFTFQRRCFTILELLIAMTLTIVVLSFLTYFYQQVSAMNTEMDKTQTDSFERRYIEYRLSRILPRTVSPTDRNVSFLFFTNPDPGGIFKEGTTSLVFTFDNCVQLNKEMAYLVIGRLYLDRDGNLILAKWPVAKRWNPGEIPPMHKEILMTNVDSLAMSFYVPPESGKYRIQPSKVIEEKEIQPPGEKIPENQPLQGSEPAPEKEEKQKTPKVEIPAELHGRWVEEWKKEYQQLPAIVKVTVVRKLEREKEETLNFAYPLPLTQQPIIYEQ